MWLLTGEVDEHGTNLDTQHVERPFLLPVTDDPQVLANLADAAEALVDFSGSLEDVLGKLGEWGFLPATGEETTPEGLDWPALIARTLADLEGSAGGLGWADRSEPPPDRNQPPPGEPVDLCPGGWPTSSGGGGAIAGEGHEAGHRAVRWCEVIAPQVQRT